MMVLCYWSTVFCVFRSLVALSLILAMLLFKPAPIYILDEVDAALDLSHTQNIGQMLRTHFRHSQVRLKPGHITVDKEPRVMAFPFPPYSLWWCPWRTACSPTPTSSLRPSLLTACPRWHALPSARVMPMFQRKLTKRLATKTREANSSSVDYLHFKIPIDVLF